MDLFDSIEVVRAPLAERMRPKTIDQFVFGNNKEQLTFIKKVVANKQLLSMIFWGPPGCGKTTLAKVIAQEVGAELEIVNAVSSGVAEVRKVIQLAEERLKYKDQRTILFIDEIHSFSKNQQNSVLEAVEAGKIVLFGGTTENIYFEVNPALLSRVKAIKLEPLSLDDIVFILDRALKDEAQGLGCANLKVDTGVLKAIAGIAEGDARYALNILEQAYFLVGDNGTIDFDFLRLAVGQKKIDMDKNGDSHYNIASAFIKSIRGSDANAALHYLARLIEGGEDIKFIARRIVISASEDIGIANPQAIVIANSCAQAALFVGFPEARIILAEAVVYLAQSPKNNDCYVAIDKAIADVKTKDCGQVPIHLRDTHYKGAAKLGYGKDYLYPHNYPGNFVEQQYMPDELRGTIYIKKS